MKFANFVQSVECGNICPGEGMSDGITNDLENGVGVADAVELIENVDENNALEASIEEIDEGIVEGETAVAELESQKEANAELIENNPEAITEETVEVAREEFNSYIYSLGYTRKDFGFKSVSLEDALSDGIENTEAVPVETSPKEELVELNQEIEVVQESISDKVRYLFNRKLKDLYDYTASNKRVIDKYVNNILPSLVSAAESRSGSIRGNLSGLAKSKVGLFALASGNTVNVDFIGKVINDSNLVTVGLVDNMYKFESMKFKQSDPDELVDEIQKAVIKIYKDVSAKYVRSESKKVLDTAVSNLGTKWYSLFDGMNKMADQAIKTGEAVPVGITGIDGSVCGLMVGTVPRKETLYEMASRYLAGGGSLVSLAFVVATVVFGKQGTYFSFVPRISVADKANNIKFEKSQSEIIADLKKIQNLAVGYDKYADALNKSYSNLASRLDNNIFKEIFARVGEESAISLANRELVSKHRQYKNTIVALTKLYSKAIKSMY